MAKKKKSNSKKKTSKKKVVKKVSKSKVNKSNISKKKVAKKSAKSKARPSRTMKKLSSDHTGKWLGIMGIVSAVTSLLILPVVFGIVGTILGILALHKGERGLGWVAIVSSLGLAVVSFSLWGLRAAFAVATIAGAVLF
jgi:hypothetical protein